MKRQPGVRVVFGGALALAGLLVLGVLGREWLHPHEAGSRFFAVLLAVVVGVPLTGLGVRILMSARVGPDPVSVRAQDPSGRTTTRRP